MPNTESIRELEQQAWGSQQDPKFRWIDMPGAAAQQWTIPQEPLLAQAPAHPMSYTQPPAPGSFRQCIDDLERLKALADEMQAVLRRLL